MKIGVRKPSIKKSFSAKTTGSYKKALKKAVNPVYGKKGMGWINDPKQAAYNKIYQKTTISAKDVVLSDGKRSNASHEYLVDDLEDDKISIEISNENIENLVLQNPNVVSILKKHKWKSNFGGIVYGVLAIAFIWMPVIAVVFGIVALWKFIKGDMFRCAINDANYFLEKAEGREGKSPKYKYSFRIDVPKYGSMKQTTKQELCFDQKKSNATDNMNCKRYLFTGKYSATKRTHKNREIEVFGDEDVRQEIIKLGYEEPISFENIPFPEMNPRQMEYFKELDNDNVPAGVCSDDARAIISRIEDHDTLASSDMFEFASEMKIAASNYSGHAILIERIFNRLAQRDKIAFFAYCVYCDRMKETIKNMNKSPVKATFYEFADKMLSEEAFIKSLTHYEGKSLRFFGTRTIDGYQITGASRSTNAYRMVKEFLQEKGLA